MGLMKTRYFYLMLAAALLAGCAKETLDNQTEISGGKTILTVGLTPQNKTHMDLVSLEGSHKVYWSNGDQLSLNGVASDSLKNLKDNYQQEATFTFEGKLDTPYRLLYPASAWVDDTHITLPAVQDYRANGFAEGMNPMCGYSADGANVSLNHLCAILKIQILQETAELAAARSGEVDTDNLVSVRFSGRNGEQVSGSFTIDYDAATLEGASDADEDKVVKIVKSQATHTETAAVYYVVVPAGNYSEGFELVIKDKCGHIMTQRKSSAKLLEAGHLYPMKAFAFVPTGTELGVEISNAEELIQFASKFNDGDYDDMGDEPLVVTLTDNIDFSVEATPSLSEQFNTEGGIGSADHAFNGIFNGNGHTISGLEATVPLFAATGDDASIDNFTIDNSCVFSFTHDKKANMNVGSVVGTHAGNLTRLSVAAVDSLTSVSGISQQTCFGGIAGRVTTGVIDHCTYSGAMTVPSGFRSTEAKIMIGGVAGYIDNASGTVSYCKFNGTVDNAGQMVANSETGDWTGAPFLTAGGIAGATVGMIDSCVVNKHATGVSVTVAEGKSFSGTLVTHTANAYHFATAGVVGYVEYGGKVKNCINKATITTLFPTERGSGGNMNGRTMVEGGVVGYNYRGTVSGCDNYGALIDRANPKVHYVGGVVARNYRGSVSSCTNQSEGDIGIGTSYGTPYGARLPYIGGVIGSHAGSGASVSNIKNYANITVSRLESTGGVMVYIGGVIGKCETAIDGSTNGGAISNSGKISQTNGNMCCSTPTTSNDYGYFLGGIAGYSTQAVKNVSNSGELVYTCTADGTTLTTAGARYIHLGGVVGKVNAASSVDVEKCVNSGKVTFTATANYADIKDKSGNVTNAGNDKVRYYYNYMGGIVGYAKNTAIKGDATKKCTNSAEIKGGDSSGNNNRDTTSFVVGGIVGYITGDSSIEYCDLTGSGAPNNDHWSNLKYTNYNCPTVGGIAGQVVGTSSKSIPVKNCIVASTAAVYARRGAAGGIVGLAEYASVSSCTVPISFNSAQSGYYYGGIAALAKNTSVSSCTYSGTAIQTSQLLIGGGVVGLLHTGSSITGCSSQAATVNKNGTAVTATGGIAGQSVSGTTIKKCHYKSTIAICGDTKFTAGTGDDANAGDL